MHIVWSTLSQHKLLSPTDKIYVKIFIKIIDSDKRIHLKLGQNTTLNGENMLIFIDILILYSFYTLILAVWPSIYLERIWNNIIV